MESQPQVERSSRLNELTGGEILFDGQDVTKLKGKQAMTKFRHEVQMIFQDPYASLNPRMKVRDIIAEGIDVNGLAKSPERTCRKSQRVTKNSWLKSQPWHTLSS